MENILKLIEKFEEFIGKSKYIQSESNQPNKKISIENI